MHLSITQIETENKELFVSLITLKAIVGHVKNRTHKKPTLSKYSNDIKHITAFQDMVVGLKPLKQYCPFIILYKSRKR